jgi:O-antigen/teichoic acid export membrane protein
MRDGNEQRYMSQPKDETIPTIDHKPHKAFFRQSGWLMIAAITGGGLTYLVHFLAKAKSVDETQYAAFGTLLTLVMTCVPSMPLQMIFAQQGAQALATGRERQLAGIIRLAGRGTFLLWALGALLVVIFQKQIVAGWHLPDATGLLVTVPVILVYIWFPMFTGVLQGRQDFFWMGWAAIVSGAGRFGAAAFLVLALAFGATGMMAGALIGVAVASAICIWRSRDLWSLPAEKFDGRKFLRQVLPLLFGFGACQFLFTADTLYAKAYFNDEQMAPYVAVGTLSRGLLWLVLPLAAVMFPKIVHASAKAQKTNLFNLVVLGTAILSVGGALGLYVTGPLLVKLVYKSGYVAEAVKLLPWYAGAMVPLALANVMVNDLLARERYGVVPWMVLLAIGYGFTLPWVLNHHPGKIEVVLQTLGVFNLLLFAVCAWFAWGNKASVAPAK